MKSETSDGQDTLVRVFTLGRFAVEIDGAPLQFETRAQRKPLELLKVLIAQGGEQVSDEILKEALWPDSDGDQAHGSFTSTLYRLRRLIGPDTLVLQDHRLTLNSERCWVDVKAFSNALDLASQSAKAGDGEQTWHHLEQALEFYRGPFLDGEFDLPEILTARERLHSIFLRHIETLSEHFKDHGNSRKVVELYQRGLEIDPLAEEFYAALMQTHLELGQAVEGIRVYRRCRDMLQSGAGMEPSPETEAIHHQLLAVRPEPTARIPQDADPPVPASVANLPWRSPGRLLTAGLVILLLAGGGMLFWSFIQASNEAAAVAAFEQDAALPLPDRPSIAVLAFDNLSGDPEQEYFSDGLSEDIITKLASLSPLFVIARNSSFQYKGKQVDIRRIGRELGVRYVLEGSVRKSAGRIRVTAQLIDAATGEHLFAKRYDRELKELFAVQNEIAYQVLADLHVKVGRGEAVPQILRSTDNLEAFDAYMRAWPLVGEFDKEANFKAEQLLLKAVELDPKFASAMGQLGVIYMQRVRRRWAPDPDEALRLSEDWARRAIEADPSNPVGLRAMSRIHSRKGNHEEAIALGERSVQLNPSDASAYMSLNWTYILALQPEAAVKAINKAIRLSPAPNPAFQMFAGNANFRSGRHEAAASEYGKLVANVSGGLLLMSGLEGLVLSNMKMGKEDQAKAAAVKLMKAFPEYTISERVESWRASAYKNFDWIAERVEILRKAGLPEGSTSSTLALPKEPSAAVAALEKEAAFPLPDRPSIAVMAFDNLSGDPDQEYFSDGLSEDIITKLASLSSLFVIARNSSFQYKGKQVDVRRIGRELGVRYVLEGSVKKSGERVRVTAQLIDAATGEHVFAKRYDRELKDIFAVQDDIANQVLADLHVKIGMGEDVLLVLRNTDNFDAFDAFMRATKLYSAFEKEANFKAEELLLKAIELDPNFAPAMVSLAWVHMEQARRRWVPDPKKAYGISERWGERAIEIDPDNASALAFLSRLQSLKGNHEQAIAMGKRAVELQPSGAGTAGILAYTYMLARQSQASLEAINKALRLAPFAPAWFHVVAGEANRWSGHHEAAVREYRKGLAKLSGGPMKDVAMVGLIVNHSILGEDDKAAAVAETLIGSNPEFTISRYVQRVKRFPYINFDWLEEDIAFLRKSGISD